MRGLLRGTLWVLFHLLASVRVHGRENMPPRGPRLLAVNHLAFLDPPFVYAEVGGSLTSGWAAEKYERHPLYGPILRLGGSIFIRRGEVDRDALGAALEVLQQGGFFWLAPEGTRSPTASLIRGRTGVAYLAYHSDALVVPAAVTGTERMWADLSRLRRPALTLTIGRPFRLPRLDHDPRPEELRRGTDEVMCQLAALLPPAYRGVYADHPRTGELTAKPEGRSTPVGGGEP